MKRIRKILWLICVCCLAILQANAQKDTAFVFIKKIPGNFVFFTVDNLENIYLLTTGNQLKKINGNGDSISVFNDVKRYGIPSSIDVNNPLKILLYYKNFSTIIVLDRFLTLRNTINLRRQNIFKVNAVTNSYDNNIWLFDEQDFKLKKIDETGNTLQETSDWRTLFEESPAPYKIIDRDNFLYIYDTARGFYVFDYYNSFKTKLLFTGWQNIEVNAKRIYGFKNDTLFIYQLNTLTLKEYPLSEIFKNATSIKAINGKIYILKNDGVYQYELR